MQGSWQKSYWPRLGLVFLVGMTLIELLLLSVAAFHQLQMVIPVTALCLGTCIFTLFSFIYFQRHPLARDPSLIAKKRQIGMTLLAALFVSVVSALVLLILRSF